MSFFHVPIAIAQIIEQFVAIIAREFLFLMEIFHVSNHFVSLAEAF
jgi:hypothetical protein